MSLKAGRPSNRKNEKLKAQLRDEMDEYIRMNVNIPKSLYKKIKLKALEMDVTITDLIINICNEAISI